MKTCPKCGTAKELDAFTKNKNSKDGLNHWCKTCANFYQRQYRDGNSKYLKDYRDGRKEHTAKNNKQYRKKRSVHITEYAKQYRAEHKEYYTEYTKQYNKDNKEREAARAKLWEKNNPEKVRVRHQKRRSLKRKVAATLTVDQWKAIIESFNDTCAYCGKSGVMEQDHFIALSKLGEYSHNNNIPACKSCNSSKKKKSFFDWYPKQEFYSKKRERKILSFLNYTGGRQQLAFMV